MPNANPLFTPIVNLFNRLVSPGEITPFNLSRLVDFPFTEWSSMQEYYLNLIRWYEGIPLRERIVDQKTGQSVDKFPIKLNPIPRTCEKHAAVLLGNTLESIREGGLPVQFFPTSETTPEAKKTIEKAMKKAFEFAGGGAMFVDAGITSQYMGGAVWRVRFDSKNEEFPVQVEYVDPVEFFGIPKGNNAWEMHDAWFVREITLKDAQSHGYIWNGMDDRFFFAEHWTEERTVVFINETLIQDEDNVFGVVPFIYIPHIRARGFIGKSLITETVQGIIREWNLRFGDVGDAVSDDSHAVLAMRGVRGNLSEVQLSDGRKVVNLGARSGIASIETEPDLFAVNTKSVSEPMVKFNTTLETQYRKEVNHPAVADGEDEGSQRSAATLTVRMWPLISHVELERINWTTGLMKLARIVLLFYATKDAYSITKEMVSTEFTIKWSSSLPRDREALVNELAIRKKNGMTSLQHVLELLGDIVDIDAEMDLIIAEEDAKHQREMETMEKKSSLMGTGEGKGNVAGKNNQEKGDRSNTDASNNLRNEDKQK